MTVSGRQQAPVVLLPFHLFPPRGHHKEVARAVSTRCCSPRRRRKTAYDAMRAAKAACAKRRAPEDMMKTSVGSAQRTRRALYAATFIIK